MDFRRAFFPQKFIKGTFTPSLLRAGAFSKVVGLYDMVCNLLGMENKNVAKWLNVNGFPEKCFHLNWEYLRLLSEEVF